MKIEEKINKVRELYNMQKEILSSINIDNFFESTYKIIYLELQKEIIKSTPTII